MGLRVQKLQLPGAEIAAWRLGIWSGMRGEDDVRRDARFVTGIHATYPDVAQGIFRSGVFRGRSFDGGVGERCLNVSATIDASQRSEVLRCVAKALRHGKNVADLLCAVTPKARWEQVKSGRVEVVQQLRAQGAVANAGEYWRMPFKRLTWRSILVTAAAVKREDGVVW